MKGKARFRPAVKSLMSVMILFALAGAIFLRQASSRAAAAATGSYIHGKVTVDKGEVLGFPVKAKDVGARVTYTVFTRRGNYRVPNLGPGAYEVWVAAEGFDSPRQSVDLKAGEPLKLDFALKVKPGFSLANQFRPRDPHTMKIKEQVELVDYDTLYPPGPGRAALEAHCFTCHGTMFHSPRKRRQGLAGDARAHDQQARHAGERLAAGEHHPREASQAGGPSGLPTTWRSTSGRGVRRWT